MAVLRSGSRGSDVKELQQKLADAGFDPGPIDGIYGPKTTAAVLAYQKANDLEADGVAGSATLGSIGLGGDDPTTGESIKTDFTDEETTRFNGLPGHPEIWKDVDTGRIYVVFYPEGMDPPFPLRYVVNSEEVLKTYFGDKSVAYDHEYTAAEMAALGAVTKGDVSEIEDTTGDPWAGFTIKMEQAAKVMPWLEDDDVFAVIAAAYLEGRTPEAYEFTGTEWYDTHNEAERAWLTTVAQDPAEATQTLETYRSKVVAEFLKLGVAVPSDEVVDYVTQQWAQGSWSNDELSDQIAAVTGGGEGVVMDEGLGNIVGDFTMSRGKKYVDTVRSLWGEWLGSAYTPTEDEVAKWAAILRDDETGGTSRLTEMLRGQRLSLFPEYGDANLTWDNISGPWKSMAYNTWGVQIDESDPFLQELVRLNDANAAGKLLRSEGYERGHNRVVNQVMNGVKSGMKSNVRGAV